MIIGTGKTKGWSLGLLAAIVVGALLLLGGEPVAQAGKGGKGGKMPKDFPKDADKAFDKVFGKGKTIPEFTVAARVISISPKVNQITVPRGRKGWVVLRSGKWPNFLKQPTDPPLQLDRIKTRDGKSLSAAEVTLEKIGNNNDYSVLMDVSPDGGLAAIRITDPVFALETAFVSLKDGKVVIPKWKPTYKRTEEYQQGTETKTRTVDVEVGGGFTNLRPFYLLSANRWLVCYRDGAILLYSTSNGTDWQQFIVRAAPPQKKEAFGGPIHSLYWCMSDDSKTLAYWTGTGFDLINTTTGKATSTTTLTVAPNERNHTVTRAVFSPDGSRLVAEVTHQRVNNRGGFAGQTSKLYHWDLKAKTAPVALEGKPFAGEFFWWGKDHLFRAGGKDLFKDKGTIIAATTGKPIAYVRWSGSRVKSQDGNLWLLLQDFGAKEASLLKARFPSTLLLELEKRAKENKVAALQVGKDGVGILPEPKK